MIQWKVVADDARPGSREPGLVASSRLRNDPYESVGTIGLA
ncbi:hypothetical protein [Paenibacillus sp. Marseille-P2973]|nr:hypothetical protein [Paenibacillus sp. Marseille-P2973]